MAKMLDFNSYRRPTLLLRMKDEQQTKLHVTTPTLELVEELKANLTELKLALTGNDTEAGAAVYELAAKLLNCNLDGVTTNAEELAVKYEMNLEDLTMFFTVYMDFLEEVKSAKN